jgi:hypothetical protein
MTKTQTSQVLVIPDCNFDEIRVRGCIVSASKAGLTKDYGFDTLTIPWSEFQIWAFAATADKPAWNPVSIFKGKMQYKVAFSAGKFTCTNIRVFSEADKFMAEVPKELFMYIAKCLGMGNKVAEWEATATEYTPATQNNSESNDSTDDEF